MYNFYTDCYFAEDEEIEAIAKPVKIDKYTQTQYGGTPIHSDGETSYVIAHDAMTCVLGATGSMKTSRVVYPTIENLSRCGQSMVIIDVKPEILSHTYTLLRERGYQIRVINLKDPMRGNRYNIFDYPSRLYTEGKRDESDEILSNIFYGIHNEDITRSKDPYWGIAAADMETGAAMVIRDNGFPITFENTIGTIIDGDKNFATTNYFSVYIDDIAGNNASSSWKLSTTATMAAKETKSCVQSVIQKSLSVYAAEGFRDQMCESDFTITDLAREKTALFIVVPAEKPTMNSYVSVLIRTAYCELCDYASDQPDGKLPICVNFLCDEFANFPPVYGFSEILTTARSRNIRFQIVIQNYAQLVSKYSNEVAQTIFSNCEVKIIMRSSDMMLSEIVERLCGMRRDPITGISSPLITTSDIQRFDKERGEILVLIDGVKPFVTTIPSIYDYPFEFEYTPMSVFVYRQKKQRKIFDIKEIVRNKKRANIFSALDHCPSDDIVKEKPTLLTRKPVSPKNEFTLNNDLDDMDDMFDIFLNDDWSV